MPTIRKSYTEATDKTPTAKVGIGPVSADFSKTSKYPLKLPADLKCNISTKSSSPITILKLEWNFQSVSDSAVLETIVSSSEMPFFVVI